MEVSAQIVQQALAARNASLAEILGIRTGQTVDAKIIAQLTGGLTRILINGTPVDTQLPQNLASQQQVRLQVLETVPNLRLGTVSDGTKPPTASPPGPPATDSRDPAAQVRTALSNQSNLLQQAVAAKAGPVTPASTPPGQPSVSAQAQSSSQTAAAPSAPQPAARQLVTILDISPAARQAQTPTQVQSLATQSPATQPIAQPATPAAPSHLISLSAASAADKITNVLNTVGEAGRPAAAETPVPPRVSQSPLPVPASVPAADAALITRSVLASVAKQDSTATLLTRILGLGSQADQLPPNVAAAVKSLAAAPVNGNLGKLSGIVLKHAIQNSGVFHENSLAKGTLAQPTDLKSNLLGLQRALFTWLGKTAGQVPSKDNRPSPPVRGAPTRAGVHTVTPQPQAGSPGELGRALASDTDAALARTRLLQMASLPDGAQRADAQPRTEIRLEIPVMLGQELSMAQLAILPDGDQSSNPEERGWTVHFALNFSRLGEVGARVDLKRKRVGVAIWTETEETADTLRDLLPELELALQAANIEPARLQVRHGLPKNLGAHSGEFLDSRS